MNFRTLGRTAWRLWRTDGLPSSGPQQPLKTDILAFVDALAKFELKAANFALVAGDRINTNTTAGAITATVPAPASLVDGDEFAFNDYAGTWGTNNLIVDGNGTLFSDGGARLVCDGAARFIVVFANGVLNVR